MLPRIRFLLAALITSIVCIVSFNDDRPVQIDTADIVQMHVQSASIGGLAGCTPAQKTTIKTAIDVLGYLCIVAHAELDVPAIATACQIDSDLTPAIKQIIDDFKARRAAFAKEQMAVARCTPPPDGGTK